MANKAENLPGRPSRLDAQTAAPSSSLGGRISKPERITDLAYRQLRDAIGGLDLEPGQSIGEPGLSERLGISRNSTREALIRLEAAGFVSRAAGGRWFVYAMTSEDAREVYECRATLEGFAARKVAGMSRAGEFDSGPLRHALEQAMRARDDDDLAAAAGFSDEFHVSMVAAAANQKLLSLLELLQPQFRYNRLMMMQHRLRNEFLEENADLLEAVEAGDGARAAECVEAIAQADLAAVLELHDRRIL